MPQMAPLSWLILFFIFSISFIIFNIFNYFCFYTIPTSSLNLMMNKKTFNTLIWKW